MQRRTNGTAPTAGALEAVNEVLRAPGHGLEPRVRAALEPGFGRDFSRVTLHTDARAAASAQAVGASAYTVGGDIVFGPGMYRSGSHQGLSLLAHELAHVVQQEGGAGAAGVLEVSPPDHPSEGEAESAATTVLRGGRVEISRLGGAGLQRWVAPDPLHDPLVEAFRQEEGLIAGIGPSDAEIKYLLNKPIQDLGRIRIDAIADFVAGDLAASREIHVHVSDPRVASIEWELVGPSGTRLPGGFATAAGAPDATTRSFRLQPSQFSGADFTAGQHRLHCFGRTASGRAIVLAIRDFNVLAADMTTGTALATPHGSLEFTQYEKTDANPPAVPRYSVDVELRFLPSSSVSCTDVAFIQSVRTIDATGRSQFHTINSEIEARQTPLAWSIDRIAGAPSPFYITGRDATGAMVDEPGWGRAGGGGASPTEATLIDRPSWNQENIFQAESCAICRSGTRLGEVYGCATWGYAATSAGAVTLMPRGFRQSPSPQFEEARVAWNVWRRSRPAAHRPARAPASRSPAP